MTSDTPSESGGQPADGPAREPGSGTDPGSTSQDQPEPNDGGASTGDDSSGRPGAHEPDAEHPQDSNEKADERATVVDP
jgi:hypothetical protein